MQQLAQLGALRNNFPRLIAGDFHIFHDKLLREFRDEHSLDKARHTAGNTSSSYELVFRRLFAKLVGKMVDDVLGPGSVSVYRRCQKES